jgi:hypothetical protein
MAWGREGVRREGGLIHDHAVELIDICFVELEDF